MNHLELINKFREELTKLSVEVETSVSMGHFDINKICEDVFCNIFKEIYNFKNLRNLNEEEKKNFPGIDLADDVERVAIQVTSDKTLEKIKDTLEKIIVHKLNEKYNKIIIYILTRKQGSYSQDSINRICQGKIDFDVKSNILDVTDLATKAANLNPRVLKKVIDIFGAYTRGCSVGLAEQDFDPPKEASEILCANLLELYFPKTLYIAELSREIFDEQDRRIYNKRRYIRDYMIKNLGRSVPSDFEVNGNSLITFYNLENKNNPFSFLIDEGTVEPFHPSDYYSIDVDHERVFKSLLRFCMQQKLYKHRVLWQHREEIFIFVPLNDSELVRKEAWKGLKKTTRTVFEKKFNKYKADKIFYVKHFAFYISFLTIHNEWYVSITPSWFFSYGEDYQRSKYSEKLLSGIKKIERNRSVFDQFRFLSSWLKDLDSDDLFSSDSGLLPQITFGDILKFDGGRCLNEDLWEPLVAQDEDDYLVQEKFRFL